MTNCPDDLVPGIDAPLGITDAGRAVVEAALISTAPATGSNGSSIGSSNVVGSATRYDELAANYLAFVPLASIRLWLAARKRVHALGLDVMFQG